MGRLWRLLGLGVAVVLAALLGFGLRSVVDPVPGRSLYCVVNEASAELRGFAVGELVNGTGEGCLPSEERICVDANLILKSSECDS